MDCKCKQLVEFLHHGNTQIRQIGMQAFAFSQIGYCLANIMLAATENLVPYSKSFPSIFKSGQCTPIKDLKLLIKDYAVCRNPDALYRSEEPC